MRYRFAFGLGRSGTTLLGRLLALTSAPARFVSELCPGIGDRIPNPAFMVEPGDAVATRRVREAIIDLGFGKSPFCEAQSHRIERDDPDAEVLLIKDIHSLLAYREIVSGLEDWRAVVVTRNPLRSLDSYFHGHTPKIRRYLVEEYKYLATHLEAEGGDAMLARAASTTPPGVLRYMRRPRLFTTELFRQAAVTEFMCHFLGAWAAADDRITQVTFEDLCRDPLGETLRLFDFLGLEYDDETLAKLHRMTTGSSSEYYATDKNSALILEQPYKYLGSRNRRRLAEFLDDGSNSKEQSR